MIKSNLGSFKQGEVRMRATIVEPSAASVMFSKLVEDIHDDDTIVEINPGPGYLTRLLVQNTCNKLLLFESREGFYKSLIQTYSKEIEQGRIKLLLNNFNYFYSYRFHYTRNADSDHTESFLDMFPEQKHVSRSNVRVLGAIEDRLFFSRLSISLLLNLSIFDKTRPTFYLYTTDKLSKRFFTPFPFVYNDSNFKHSLQNNFLFNFSHLATEKSCSFHPLLPRTGKCSTIDTRIYHLVKLEPAWDLMTKMCREERALFMFFLMQLSALPHENLLLKTLERWVTDFGVSLIDAGFRVFTYAQELNKEEVMFVYYMFRQHQNFQESRFVEMKDAWMKDSWASNSNAETMELLRRHEEE